MSGPRRDNAHDRAELGISRLSEGLIQAFAVQAGFLGDGAHAARTRNETEGVAHEIGVTGFQRGGNIGGLALFSVEIVGGIEARRLGSTLTVVFAAFGITMSPLVAELA